MPTEKYDFTVSNPNLVVDADLRTYLADHASNVWWLQGDAAYVTLVSSAVSEAKNVRDGGVIMSQGTAGSRPTLATEAEFNDYTGFNFDGTDDYLALVGAGQDLSTTWSKIILLVPDSVSGTQGIWARDGGGGSAHQMYRSTTHLKFTHRGTDFNLATGISAAAPYLVVVSGTGTTLRYTVNGSGIQTRSCTGTLPTGTDVLGSVTVSSARFDGRISDAISLNIDLLDTSIDANVELRSYWGRYFNDVYGRTL